MIVNKKVNVLLQSAHMWPKKVIDTCKLCIFYSNLD